MRVTTLGKGGSGKTTVATLLTRYAMATCENVLAIDADINDHFGEYIGFSEKAPAVGHAFDELVKRLYCKPETELPPIGTIPPTKEDTFLHLNADDWFLKKYALHRDNLFYLNVGKYENDEVGDTCFHGKLNALEFALHRFLDTDKDYVVIDAAAGADVLATSLYFASDVFFFVIEPTERSVSVYNDYVSTLKDKIEKYHIAIKPVFNKVRNQEDLDFLRKHIAVPSDEEIVFDFDPDFRAIEQGRMDAIETLQNKYHDQLTMMLTMTKNHPRDDSRYLNNVHITFTDECEKWVNETMGKDMTELIDTEFSYTDCR